MNVIYYKYAAAVMGGGRSTLWHIDRMPSAPLAGVGCSEMLATQSLPLSKLQLLPVGDLLLNYHPGFVGI